MYLLFSQAALESLRCLQRVMKNTINQSGLVMLLISLGARLFVAERALNAPFEFYAGVTDRANIISLSSWVIEAQAGCTTI